MLLRDTQNSIFFNFKKIDGWTTGSRFTDTPNRNRTVLKCLLVLVLNRTAVNNSESAVSKIQPNLWTPISIPLAVTCGARYWTPHLFRRTAAVLTLTEPRGRPQVPERPPLKRLIHSFMTRKTQKITISAGQAILGCSRRIFSPIIIRIKLRWKLSYLSWYMPSSTRSICRLCFKKIISHEELK